jgi:hypothetical protein
VPITEGMLVQEEGSAEVYLIRDGERLHIPTPYVMDALSLSWNDVQHVAAGSLAQVPRDTSWDPLGSSTPGSTVFVPVGNFPGGLGAVWWPLDLATVKRHVAWGVEVHTIELRGWITGPGGPNPLDPDFSYGLEVDVAWVLERGIDLTALIKVGNILGIGAPQAGITDPRAWCATPDIKMEICGFPPKQQRSRVYPPDWITELPGVLLDAPDAGAANHKPPKWPFDPGMPPPGNVTINGGEYVRVYGSIVSDKAHPKPSGAPVVSDQAWQRAVGLWQQAGRDNWPDCQARWTEVHPPDWIEVVHPPKPINQVFRGVAVAAPGAFSWNPTLTSTLDVDILALPKPSPDAILQFEEFVGPETDVGTIVDGNATKTGALISELTNPDGIRVHVKVAGAKSPFGGQTGKFRALYWLHWEVPDHPKRPPQAPDPSPWTLLLDGPP